MNALVLDCAADGMAEDPVAITGRGLCDTVHTSAASVFLILAYEDLR